MKLGIIIFAATALVFASVAQAAGPITGKVRGKFDRTTKIFSGLELRRYILTPRTRRR